MKDYYLLLGINKKADKSEIKKAYKDSAKKFHPDSGAVTKDTKRFREITEAYETLYDNNKRKKYDESFTDNVPITSNFVEPLKSNYPQYSQRYTLNPNLHDHPEDLLSGCYGRSLSRRKTLNCVIHLTPQEIQNDVEYPYTINIVKPCPHCNSYFSRFMFFCPYCNGSQYLYTKKELIVNIPKGIENGSCVQLELEHVGLSGVNLMVNVLISSAWREE